MQTMLTGYPINVPSYNKAVKCINRTLRWKWKLGKTPLSKGTADCSGLSTLCSFSISHFLPWHELALAARALPGLLWALQPRMCTEGGGRETWKESGSLRPGEATGVACIWSPYTAGEKQIPVLFTQNHSGILLLGASHHSWVTGTRAWCQIKPWSALSPGFWGSYSLCVNWFMCQMRLTVIDPFSPRVALIIKQHNLSNTHEPRPKGLMIIFLFLFFSGYSYYKRAIHPWLKVRQKLATEYGWQWTDLLPKRLPKQGTQKYWEG